MKTEGMVEYEVTITVSEPQIIVEIFKLLLGHKREEPLRADPLGIRGEE